MPGLLDLPLVDGTHLADGCRWSQQSPEDAVRAACVVVPAALRGEAQRAYASHLHQAGWTLSADHGNAATFERAIPSSDCVNRLDVVVSYNAGMPDVLAAQQSGTLDAIDLGFLFLMRAQPVCGGAREPAP